MKSEHDENTMLKEMKLFAFQLSSETIVHNKGFQLNSNPRLNKFQYGILVFF